MKELAGAMLEKIGEQIEEIGERIALEKWEGLSNRIKTLRELIKHAEALEQMRSL